MKDYVTNSFRKRRQDLDAMTHALQQANGLKTQLRKDTE
jgi:hypothetical protein